MVIRGGIVKKNLLYSFIYEFIVAFYPMILIPYLSNTIGKTGVGIYSYTYSIVGIFLLFSQLGVNTLGTRAIAQNQDKPEKLAKTFKSIFCVQLISGIISTLVYIVCFICIYNKYNVYFILLLPFLVGQTIRISWFFLGKEQLQVILLRNILIRVISTVLIVLFVKSIEQLPLYFIIMSCSYLLGDISVWPKALKQLYSVKITWNDVRVYIKPMCLLFLPILALRGAYYTDEVMLGVVHNAESVAIYENAYKIVNMPLQLYTVLANVLTAQASRLVSMHKTKENQMYIINSIDLSSAFMIPIIIGIISIANELVPWYMGKQFLETIDVMQILPWVLIFSGINNILRTQYFIPMNKDSKYIGTIFIGVSINVLLNVLLIKQYAYVGVAVATIISEAVVTIISICMTKKDIKFLQAFKNFPSYLIFSTIMALIVRYIGNLMGDGYLTTLIQVIAGFMAYMLLLLTYQSHICKNDAINIYLIIKNVVRKLVR